MKLYCLGACEEVGRSAFILETDRRVMLDYGVKIYDVYGKPSYPLDFSVQLDAAIISHAHLDHSGYVPYLYKNSKTIRWFSTPPTYDVVDVLWKDSMKIQGPELPWGRSQYKKALKYWNPIFYNDSISFGATEYSFFDAGHILGSAMILAEYEGKSILYTGDFKLEKTNLHEGAKFDGEVDVLIIDSTYSDREHPDRERLEEKFMEEVEETVENGGVVLCPAFAVGRSQELIQIIRKYNSEIEVYLDGMSKTVTDIYLHHKKYLRSPSTFVKNVKTVNFINSIKNKKDALNKGGVIISTAGMMQGGPALNYLMHLNPESKVIFTGYCVEGTNGWLLQNKNQVEIDGNLLDVDLEVEYFDFSAHAGRSDIIEMIKRCNPELIVCVHGDRTKEFAEELKEDFGFNAVAPALGDTLFL